MSILLIHIFVGLLLYPAAMDMWYRIRHKQCEFYAPDSINWYLGFAFFVLTWELAFPILTVSYFKEMKK